MAKVSIATPEKTHVVDPPEGFAGTAETSVYFDRDQDPLHVHQHRLARNATLRIGPKATDCMVYVWKGAVAGGGRSLAAGSSLIVEHGATVQITGTDDNAVLLTFSAALAPAKQRAGGHVHLLPADRVPRAANMSGGGGVDGGMHADASCPSCQVWLHENSLAPLKHELSEADLERGIHSHTEDEVIFIIGGEMRLGNRPCGPGTAIAIAADTLYSFGIGPEGLKFINFRAGRPSEIKFKNGNAMDEVAYWRDKTGSPQYLAPVTG